MTHVRTSPFYPQSNGKIERWHESLKGECIRPGTPLSLDDARRLVEGYVEHYNNLRLNSAIGYITPKDMLDGRQPEIHAARDRKLEAARNLAQTIMAANPEEKGPLQSRIQRLRRETKDALIARVLRLERIVEEQKAAENALRDEIVRLSADRPSSK